MTTITWIDQPWHYTTFWDGLDHWQTLIAGALALLAGFGTVWMTRHIANRQIKATLKQIDTTVRLEQDRVAREASAFHAVLAAAMARVLAEAAGAKSVYPNFLTKTEGLSIQALAVRQCITKGAFAELRGAFFRQGSLLTGEFLDLEREIDNFAAQCELDIQISQAMHQPIRKGKNAGLGDQLASIERKADALREKAAARI